MFKVGDQVKITKQTRERFMREYPGHHHAFVRACREDAVLIIKSIGPFNSMSFSSDEIPNLDWSSDDSSEFELWQRKKRTLIQKVV